MTTEDEAAAKGYATKDAVVSAHDRRSVLPTYVAPASDSKFNTVRPGVAAIACFRLNEALFDFDSSVLKPGVRDSTPRFSGLVRANKGCLAAVFGHADATGTDSYNTELSGRRAHALHALLVRDVAAWEQLYKEPLGNDRWGVRSLQVMLGALSDPLAPASAAKAPYYVGEPSGELDAQTRASVRRFQGDQALKVDGEPGPDTRARLFQVYMDAICVDTNGAPFVMKREQFIGRGTDPKGKGAYQACSEFNPVLVLSKADQQKFDSGASPAHERNARVASNRRAMIFLFDADVPVTAATWPCPRVGEGSAGCRKMFWPDGDERRAPAAEEREYRTNQRTMACSWYDRFARFSPCEGRTFTRISVTLRDRFAELIDNAPFRMNAAGRKREGRAAGGVVTMTVPGVPERCLVEWGRADDPEVAAMKGAPPFKVLLYVTHEIGSRQEQGKKRLHNIGYPDSHPLDVAISAFQGDMDLPVTGELDDPTHLALVAAHGTLATSVASLDEAKNANG